MLWEFVSVHEGFGDSNCVWCESLGIIYIGLRWKGGIGGLLFCYINLLGYLHASPFPEATIHF